MLTRFYYNHQHVHLRRLPLLFCTGVLLSRSPPHLFQKSLMTGLPLETLQLPSFTLVLKVSTN